MIENIDDNMGKLMAFLDQSGVAKDTLLIFMTDNGGTAGVKTFNAGMRGAKVPHTWVAPEFQHFGAGPRVSRGQRLQQADRPHRHISHHASNYKHPDAQRSCITS